MSAHVSLSVRRSVFAVALGISASFASAQVSSLSLTFNGAEGGYQNTGFDAAYNPDNTGFNLNFGGNGKLGILTNPGDIYGNYENDPDTAKNVFYTNFNVSDRTVAEVRVNAINLNQNFHGGGVWMGTDQDHYIRLGTIFNGFEGGVDIEALRENEDRWAQDNTYPNRPGFDIEGRHMGVQGSSVPTTAAGGAATGRDLNNVVLRLIRDGNAVAGYVSLDGGATFTRMGGDTYSFNSFATDATTLRVDNRTASNPNNPDLSSSTVEGGFKVGVYAFGGGSSPAVIQFDSITAVTGTPTYTGPANGTWTDNANWNNNNGIGAPTNIESTAVLPTSASTRTLDVPSNIVLTNVRFESAAGTTVSGTGQITFDWFYYPSHPDYYNVGPGLVSVTAGNHTISAPTVLAHLHRFDIAGGTSLTLSDLQASPFNSENPANNQDAGIRKLGAGTLNVSRLQTNQIDVQAGTLKINSGAAVSTVKSIAVSTTVGSTAKLDIADNALIVDYDGTSSPLVSIGDAIAAAYGTGTWTGPGITSSAAATGTSMGIGFGEATEFTTVPTIFGTVDTTAVLIRYTLKGDTDLNGSVNFNDLLRLARSYNLTGKSWVHGDANYDGTINFNDLLALAKNYGAGVVQLDSSFAADFAADWALAQSLVPEPTSLFLIALAPIAGRRRRA